MGTGIIIDRRAAKNRSAGNRKAFVDRYKDVIKGHVERLANSKSRSITDITKKKTISISKKSVEEPHYIYDQDDGNIDRIIPGNDKWVNGDRINRPKQGGGGGGSGAGQGGEDGEDDFSFDLTKEEFLRIYLDDLELPNLTKYGVKKSDHVEIQRAGYTKEGSPCRLDIKKTFENAIARRIATREDDKPIAFLDEIDLRYRNFVEIRKPSRHAVVFFMLDVSASMDENLKMLAKKFFMLFYIFLEKEYTKVDVVFIRHTTDASEVDEKTFFYDRQSGGTEFLRAFQLIDSIISERYDHNSVNIYLAQASDGDVFQQDAGDSLAFLQNNLLKKLQYYAYIETRAYNYTPDFTWHSIIKKHLNTDVVGTKQVRETEDVIIAIRHLFKKRS